MKRIQGQGNLQKSSFLQQNIMIFQIICGTCGAQGRRGSLERNSLRSSGNLRIRGQGNLRIQDQEKSKEK